MFQSSNAFDLLKAEPNAKEVLLVFTIGVRCPQNQVAIGQEVANSPNS